MSRPQSQKMQVERQAEVPDKESVGGSPYRKVYVCDEARNSAALFCSNKIKTSKYTPLNFIFKNLWFQFHKVANVYFVFCGVLETLPKVTTTNGVPTYALPLLFVLGVTAVKDAIEDYQRHKADEEENNRVTKVFDRNKKVFNETKWIDVKVGDIVRVQNRDMIPADMLMIASSNENGLMYSMTANLDGETNLKLRKVHAGIAIDAKSTSIKTECGKLFACIDCE